MYASMLYSGGDDKTVRIWNIHSSFCVQVLKDLTSLVSSVAFSPNGWYLAATDTNGILAVWSTKATIAKIKLNSEQCLNRILMFAVVDPFEVASMQCHDSRQQ